MGKNKRKSLNPPHAVQNSSAPEEPSAANCFQGDDLTDLLQKIGRELELAKQSRGCLPEKIWMKQQFSIGVNDVTRLLERMPKAVSGNSSDESLIVRNTTPPRVQLQAVLVATDCSPKWLTKHIPVLALSRGVPIIFVKDNRGASLRLGELVKLKTTLALGIKSKASRINAVVDGILCETGLK